MCWFGGREGIVKFVKTIVDNMIRIAAGVGLAMAAGCASPSLDVARAPFSRESIEWQDLWVESADASELPRVLMLGDSISRQYRGRVSQLLRGKAAIANSAGSRCVGDPALLAETRYVLSLYDWDVIHLNNGLHGGSCSDEDFARHLKEWIDLIREIRPKAKLVWGTITTTHDAFAPRVAVRNAAADRVIASYGDIAVDDLGKISREHPEYLSGDKVHFNGQGVQALGDAVAASVEKWLSD